MEENKIKKIEDILLSRFVNIPLQHVYISIIPLDIKIIKMTTGIYALKIFIRQEDCKLLDESFDEIHRFDINTPQHIFDMRYPEYLLECRCYWDGSTRRYYNSCYGHLKNMMMQYFNITACCFEFIPDVSYTRYKINKLIIESQWVRYKISELDWIFEPGTPNSKGIVEKAKRI